MRGVRAPIRMWLMREGKFGRNSNFANTETTPRLVGCGCSHLKILAVPGYAIPAYRGMSNSELIATYKAVPDRSPASTSANNAALISCYSHSLHRSAVHLYGIYGEFNTRVHDPATGGAAVLRLAYHNTIVAIRHSERLHRAPPGNVDGVLEAANSSISDGRIIRANDPDT